jgi:tyrosine-protein kinase Etk/Wzc
VNTGNQESSLPPEGETRLLDLAIVLAKRKKLVLGLPLVVAIIAVAVSLLLPKIYTGTAKMLPPQQKESAAAAMLGTLAGTPTIGAGALLGYALGITNPKDLYVGILKSRSIADRLIERFNLRELYRAPTMIKARKKLSSATRISAGRDGLITIEVDDEDPQRAASMANAYIEELDRLMQTLAVSEASQRRLFFEKQLASAREQLVNAELALRKAIETKGIAGIDAQSRAVVSTVEQLRAQIAVREIQIDAMRSFATQQNPEAARLRQEVASMKSELARLEGGRPEANGNSSPAGLENIRRLREVKFLEFTAELLTKQYELAKIDEANDAILIQLVDKALPPDEKSGPKRTIIVLASALTATILAVLLAFAAEAMERARNDPESAGRLGALRQHLRWRK